MGLVTNPYKAFQVCHGYKIDHELILWSPGVIGALDNAQEKLCKQILLENAKGGPRVFYSVEDALKAETSRLPKPRVRQQAAIKMCAQILDRAEDIGLITGIKDVYGLMDYCMARLGFGDGVKWHPSREIEEFVDRELKHMGKKLEKIKRG